jgi:high-affinity nickel permease
MNILLPYATALFLGAMHAFEADHLAAVTSFAVRRPSGRAAMSYGVRWAFGHGLVVIIVGTALSLLRISVAPDAGAWLDRIVGIALVGLGGWTWLSASAMHAHQHVHPDGTAHVHLHSHLAQSQHDHDHNRAATAMGLLHGLAGSVPIFVLLPVTRINSTPLAFGYLMLFAIGTAASMGLYAMFAGVVAGRAAITSAKLARILIRVTSVATCAIGVVWVVR